MNTYRYVCNDNGYSYLYWSDWLSECPSAAPLHFLIFMACFVAIGLLAAGLCGAFSTQTPAPDIDAETQRMRKEADYHDAQIKAQMKKHQLTVLDDWIDRNGLR